MDFLVASTGDKPSSLITRSTFSTTTMASSTSKPMANTKPNIVRVLMVKPQAAITPKVPNNTTGTAMVGIKVARIFCRNRYITKNTKTIASNRVETTSSIDSFTNGLVSIALYILRPCGKLAESSSNFASTAFWVSSALAPVANLIPIPEAGFPSKRVIKSELSPPSSTRATSLMRI